MRWDDIDWWKLVTWPASHESGMDVRVCRSFLCLLWVSFCIFPAALCPLLYRTRCILQHCTLHVCVRCSASSGPQLHRCAPETGGERGAHGWGHMGSPCAAARGLVKLVSHNSPLTVCVWVCADENSIVRGLQHVLFRVTGLLAVCLTAMVDNEALCVIMCPILNQISVWKKEPIWEMCVGWIIAVSRCKDNDHSIQPAHLDLLLATPTSDPKTDVAMTCDMLNCFSWLEDSLRNAKRPWTKRKINDKKLFNWSFQQLLDGSYSGG